MPFFRIVCAKTRKVLAAVSAIDAVTAACLGRAAYGPDIYVEKLARMETQSTTEKLIHDLRIEADICKALEIRLN